jgi:hypothetical protein
MSSKPQDHNIFSNEPAEARKKAGTEHRPADSDIFGASDGAAGAKRGNSAGKNISDTTLDLGSGYPEPAKVTPKV